MENERIQALPVFTSSTDLHLAPDSQNSVIDYRAIALTDVTVDIDDAITSSTIPDIGADDYTIATMAVGEVAKKAKIQIYPNPVSDVLTVLSSKNVSFISVYNVEGQLIQEANNANIINLAKLYSGVYFVKTVVEGKRK
jgi:hypothetical protein